MATTDWRIGSWNCRSLNFLGFEFALANELQPRNFDVVALQEVCLEEEQVLNWPGQQTNSRFFLSGGTDKKLGSGFIVRGKMQDRVFGFTAFSERMSKLRIRGRFFNYSIIDVHCPHEEKTDDEKEAFYATLHGKKSGQCIRKRPATNPFTLDVIKFDNKFFEYACNVNRFVNKPQLHCLRVANISAHTLIRCVMCDAYNCQIVLDQSKQAVQNKNKQKSFDGTGGTFPSR
ncbi:craniofacial development protein 2-like [Culex quinquefasciatus]|uniref:craniofacial development protein 2-like n=1 Tax=Culex quinquefasciatus TaxID=7176 RepID=UPI0018E30069|nr:craniofacial development protein 2-like [Culex quinquefasciatus]